MIIDSNGENALKQYNALGKDSGIKVVVVQDEKDGEFSHAVGFFNSQSVVVIQVKDINIVKELLDKNPGHPLIIDPQRSKIYQLPHELLPSNFANIEGALYEAEPPILETGIFASPDKDSIISSSHPLPQPQEKLDKPVAIDPLQEALGVLIARAQSGDSYSLNQVLAIAHAVISYGIIESQNQLEREKVDPQILRKNIERLSTPQMGQDNKECRAALSRNLRAVRDSYNDGVISQELFIQTMIVGVNLHDLLNKMSLLTAEGLTKERYKEKSNKNYLEYFTILEKFKGLIIKPGESLMTSIHTDIYRGQAEKLIKESLANDRKYKIPHDLSIRKTSLTISDEERRDVLIKSLSVKQYLISKEPQDTWGQFCAHICARGTAEHIMKLNNILDQLDSYQIQEQWLSSIFTQENIPEQPLETLKKLERAFQDIANSGFLKKIDKATNLIGKMEGQISKWADPKKFDSLYQNLQENLQEINQNLEWKENRSNLEKILMEQQEHKLFNIIDKSIKTLQLSSLYTEDHKDQKGYNLKVSRFKDMLSPFFDLMKIVVNIAAPQIAKDVKGVIIQYRLDRIEQFLKQRNIANATKIELSPSANFDVNRATINITGNILEPNTLADVHSLIHQTGEIGCNYIRKEIGINDKIISQCPLLVQSLYDKLINNISLPGGTKPNPSTRVDIEYPNIIITINIPLKGHSVSTKIHYNRTNNEIISSFSMFGQNEGNRWDNIVLDVKLDSIVAGLKFVQEPCSDIQKGTVISAIKIDNELQVDALITIIQKSVDTSNLSHDALSVKSKLVEERIKLLKPYYKNHPDEEFKKCASLMKIMLLEPKKFFGLGALLSGNDLITLSKNSVEILGKLSEYCDKKEIFEICLYHELYNLSKTQPYIEIYDTCLKQITNKNGELNISLVELLKDTDEKKQVDILFTLLKLRDNTTPIFKSIFKELLNEKAELLNILKPQAQNILKYYLVKLSHTKNLKSKFTDKISLQDYNYNLKEILNGVAKALSSLDKKEQRYFIPEIVKLSNPVELIELCKHLDSNTQEELIHNHLPLDRNNYDPLQLRLREVELLQVLDPKVQQGTAIE